MTLLIEKNKLFMIYLTSIILTWSLFPYLSDFLAILILFRYIFLVKKIPKKIFFWILFCLSILLSAILSLNISNLIFVIRYSLHSLVVILLFFNLSKKNIIKILTFLQYIVLPIALIYVYYLSIQDPHNLYTLGYGLFSGAKNHFGYFIIGNYFTILLLTDNFSYRFKFLTLITLIEINYTHSLTAFISFTAAILVFVLYKLKNKKWFFGIVGVAILLLIISFSFINFSFLDSNIFQGTEINYFINRTLNIQNDASWNIRSNYLFKKFNNKFQRSHIINLFFGYGNFKNFQREHPFDNSYFAVLLGGGLFLIVVLILLITRNFLWLKNKHKLIYLFIFALYTLLYFASANILFEIQNIYPMIMLFFGKDFINYHDRYQSKQYKSLK
jgi:hypothetical protein